MAARTSISDGKVPSSLAGVDIGGGRICDGWELRITARCLEEDLNADPAGDFSDLSHNMVKALVRERSSSPTALAEVTGLRSGHTVHKLAHGEDLRGGTWFNDEYDVVWLLAAGWHRNKAADDFYPYCQSLDAARRLFPTKSDYERMLRDRANWFAAAVRVEAPLVLLEARRNPGTEIQHTIGGEFGARIAVEVDDDVELIALAFDGNCLTHYQKVVAVLAAIDPGGEWVSTTQLPGRELTAGEIGFELIRER